MLWLIFTLFGWINNGANESTIHFLRNKSFLFFNRLCPKGTTAPPPNTKNVVIYDRFTQSSPYRLNKIMRVMATTNHVTVTASIKMYLGFIMVTIFVEQKTK